MLETGPRIFPAMLDDEELAAVLLMLERAPRYGITPEMIATRSGLTLGRLTLILARQHRPTFGEAQAVCRAVASYCEPHRATSEEITLV